MRFTNLIKDLLRLDELETEIYKSCAVPFHDIKLDRGIIDKLNHIETLQKYHVKVLASALGLNCIDISAEEEND